MGYWHSTGALGLWLMLASCVTVNVYFPAAAADDAARTIVRDVLGTESEPASKPDARPAPASDEGATFRPEIPGARLAFALLNFFVASAHAQANIDIDTPAVAALRASLKKRAGQLEPYYLSGAIGLTNDGLIAERDPAKVALKDRNTLKQLVGADNQDRTALYREIARANDHPEWEQEIRATFARVWVDEAPAGYWYQDGSGGWKQK